MGVTFRPWRDMMGGRLGGVGGDRRWRGFGVDSLGGRLISSCDSRSATYKY